MEIEHVLTDRVRPDERSDPTYEAWKLKLHATKKIWSGLFRSYLRGMEIELNPADIDVIDTFRSYLRGMEINQSLL